MGEESLISVNKMSKKYCRSFRRSMVYGVKDIASDVFGSRRENTALRRDEFWGVKDVDFELKRGECLGLIGPNGSGKSTLLKIVNGIIYPDIGEVRTRGDVGAMIEVGAGFHPMLTGRENIFLSGAILGMTRKYIENSLNDIISFAELEESIDMPVKHYSSGMYVRLGFSIASRLRTDIVLLDEVFSVGDVRFQAKCFNAIHNMLNDSAVIFVSHSMAQIARISSKVAYMSGGQLEMYEEPMQGIEQYNKYSSVQKKEIVTGSGRAEILDFSINNSGRCDVSSIKYLNSFVLDIKAKIDSAVKSPEVVISFYSSDSRIVAQCHSYYNSAELHSDGDDLRLRVEIRDFCLNPGSYDIAVAIMSENNKEVLTRIDNMAKITVTGDFVGYASVQLNGHWRTG